ncbi:MAG: hypothetical protein AVDCRST_MAG64-4539 [uncultured Phycisphaerae bacterium]|uniref:Type IV fimbrial biogenesis protein PilV n=1 Tax=uncultured Phycisphaerae bacterium TaxID=904963 RepID=A0A6J4QPQ3_9BACT|nr:MAG: hypothetical protein AVDCRST_MAG64-4539 [uncultured Phycisphaerae bacterium]
MTGYVVPAPAVRPPRRGFTLIEAALTVAIVGFAILSLMTLSAALTGQNAAAGQSTTALLLASNVQEGMAGLSFNDPAFANTYFGPEPGEALASFNDVDDFDGQTFSPPIDAARRPVPGLAQYSQVVTVLPVYANRLNSNANPASLDLPRTAYTGAARVLVRVMYRPHPAAAAREVYRTSWIRTAG